MSIKVSGSFTGTGIGSATMTVFRFGKGSNERKCRIRLTNTGVGVIQLERQGPDDAQYVPIYAGGSQIFKWSYAGSALEEPFEEGADGAQYRLNCTGFTSGQIDWELTA